MTGLKITFLEFTFDVCLLVAYAPSFFVVILFASIFFPYIFVLLQKLPHVHIAFI